MPPQPFPPIHDGVLSVIVPIYNEAATVREALDAILAKAKPVAAELLEAAPSDIEFEQGRFRVAGTDRSIAMTEVAKAFYRPFGARRGLEASGAWAAALILDFPGRSGIAHGRGPAPR